MGGMAIMGLGSLASAGLGYMGSQNQAKASKEAANAQLYGQMMALQQQQQQFAQTQANIAPYLATGSGAANQLTQNLPWLTTPFTPDQKTLENTPGYQWNLSQGLKATQNSAAARGLGVSGAALKGAANYATGLADNTLNTQFNIDQTNKTNAFNKLYQTAGLGASAAVGQGSISQANANAQSSAYGGMGNAMAQGYLGPAAATNAGYGAISGGLNNLTSMAFMNNLARGQGGGGSTMFNGLGFNPFGDTSGIRGA